MTARARSRTDRKFNLAVHVVGRVRDGHVRAGRLAVAGLARRRRRVRRGRGRAVATAAGGVGGKLDVDLAVDVRGLVGDGESRTRRVGVATRARTLGRVRGRRRRAVASVTGLLGAVDKRPLRRVDLAAALQRRSVTVGSRAGLRRRVPGGRGAVGKRDAGPHHVDLVIQVDALVGRLWYDVARRTLDGGGETGLQVSLVRTHSALGGGSFAANRLGRSGVVYTAVAGGARLGRVGVRWQLARRVAGRPQGQAGKQRNERAT